MRLFSSISCLSRSPKFMHLPPRNGICICVSNNIILHKKSSKTCEHSKRVLILLKTGINISKSITKLTVPQLHDLKLNLIKVYLVQLLDELHNSYRENPLGRAFGFLQSSNNNFLKKCYSVYTMSNPSAGGSVLLEHS